VLALGAGVNVGVGGPAVGLRVGVSVTVAVPVIVGDTSTNGVVTTVLDETLVPNGGATCPPTPAGRGELVAVETGGVFSAGPD
jgi:hypothetical protein